MQLNTKRVLCVLSALISLELAIGTGQLKITGHMIPEAWIPAVQDWAAALAVVGTTIMAAITGGSWYADSSSADVPKPNNQSVTVTSIAAVLILGAVLAIVVPGDDALAQTKLQSAAQRNDINRPGGQQALSPLAPAGGISSVVDKFYSTSKADLEVALAYAQFGEDKSAVACYTEWLKQIDGINELRQKYPDPSGIQLITAFQKARNLVKRLDTDSPLRQACAALAMDAKSDVQELISKLVTGAAVKAFLPTLP